MNKPQDRMLKEALLHLSTDRHSLAAELEVHLPADHTFEDDVWNTWTWGKLGHRNGTATANFGSIKHIELRIAMKLLV